MTVNTLADRIEQVRERVRRNEPRHYDPEAFHVEKSEITMELTLIIRMLDPGRDNRRAVTRQQPRRG